MRRAASSPHHRSGVFILLVLSSAVLACEAGDRPSAGTERTTTVAATDGPDTGPTVMATEPTVTAPASVSPSSPAPTTVPPMPTSSSVDANDTSHDTMPGVGGRLEHPAGLTLRYPSGWHETGTVIATEFSIGATCVSTQIVDFEPPTDPDVAEAGSMLMSVVQVCARPTGERDLDEFMQATYGGTGGFAQVDLGGVQAYQSGTEREAVRFLQDGDSIYEVLTSVVATVTLERQRIHEIEEILRSVRFD